MFIDFAAKFLFYWIRDISVVSEHDLGQLWATLLNDHFEFYVAAFCTLRVVWFGWADPIGNHLYRSSFVVAA
jgi:hypothetical protein